MSKNPRASDPRGDRVGETAPAYRPSAGTSTRTILVAARGRLVLPADVRGQLNIQEGDALALSVEVDGSIRLQTKKAIVSRMQGAFAHLAPGGRSLVEELVADRRLEAAEEGRRERELAARHQAPGPKARR